MTTIQKGPQDKLYLISPETNDTDYFYKRSWYKYVKYYDDRKSSVTVSPTSTDYVEIKVEGTTFFNPAMSRLKRHYMIPDVSANYNIAYNSVVCDIKKVEFFERGSSQSLQSNEYVPEYSDVAQKLNVPRLAAQRGDLIDGFWNTTPTSDNLRPQKDNWQAYSADEPQYVIQGAVGNGSHAGDIHINRDQYLKDILPETFIAQNQTLNFPRGCMFRFTFGEATNFGFVTSALASMNSGGTAITKNITVDTIELWLAVEQNPAVIDEVQTAINSEKGLQFYYKKLFTVRNPISAMVTHKHVAPFTDSDAPILVKAITTAYAGTQDVNDRFDRANIDDTAWSTTLSNNGIPEIGTKIKSYKTYLGSLPIQDNDIQSNNDVANNGTVPTQDYLLHKEMIKNTCMPFEYSYAYNWVHVENWSGVNNADDAVVPIKNIISGKNMEEAKDIIYRLEATTTNLALNWFTFFIGMRKMRITKNGVEA